jgi:anti-sigma factor RsiW
MTKLTRDVISDLWPLYVTGEASPDTRRLVEEFLASDPTFEKDAARGGERSALRLFAAVAAARPSVEDVRPHQAPPLGLSNAAPAGDPLLVFRLAYEITPLIEMRGGERMQVGFNFSLYAEAAEEDAEDTAAGEALKQEMEAFVQDALAIEAGAAQDREALAQLERRLGQLAVKWSHW